MSKYIRLTKGLKDKGILIKPDELSKYIKNQNEDYYTSVYYYDDNHLAQFKQKGTVAGIEDVTTDTIIFDLDNKENPEAARLDAIEVVKRLKTFNIKNENIKIWFSGKKGFTISVKFPRLLSPDQIRKIATVKIGKGLQTLDTTVYNANRILRVPLTRHPDTGLFKIPLDLSELTDNNIEQIKEYASSLDNLGEEEVQLIAEPTDDFFDLPIDQVQKSQYEIKLDEKPPQWRNCKWSLLQGNFGIGAGERHEALMIIAASCKALGYDKVTTYYLCKSALKKQAAITGRDEFPKEELWKNIIEDTVFKETWNGAQYTCKKEGTWLHKYCKSLGDKGCQSSLSEHENIVEIEDAFQLFKNYAENIDSVTIKTGIPQLDAKLRLTIGMSVGIVAPPGVGKTSIAIQILNNMSKMGHKSLFFSYDMFHSLIYQKLAQKHFGLSSDEIFEKFKNKDVEFQRKVADKIKEEYGHVHFCFNGGQSIDDIIATIKESERISGQKVKLIIMDYNELIMTEYSDATASSAYVAQKLRQIANEMQICVVSLFQPSKVSGSPADELKSYRSVKGSSAIEQSVSVMLGMNRPGFDPRKPEDDQFITINCLKNRMGSLFSLDLHWDGLSGSVRQMSLKEKALLEEVRKRKSEEEPENKKQW